MPKDAAVINQFIKSEPQDPESCYVGLMSGTSADAIDAAVVSFQARSVQLLAAKNSPIDTSLLSEIRHLMQPGGDNEMARCARLDTELGHVFAEAALSVVQQAGLKTTNIQAIGSHGQTLRHAPQDGSPYSIQIGQPAVIAEYTGITTVGHFRQSDLAAGGQGAPLAPLFHRALFSAPKIARVIVNIGGIANVSILRGDPRQPAAGFDCGPGNTLMDHHCQQARGYDFDLNGQWASSGQVDEELLQKLLQDSYFSCPPPKSTGLEYFNQNWLHQYCGTTPIQPDDLQATLLELTAITITDAIKHHATQTQEVYICGGGSNNRYLMQRLSDYLQPLPVADTTMLGLAPDWVEAVGFAWLASQALAGLAVNTTPITGARHAVICGAIYHAR